MATSAIRQLSPSLRPDTQRSDSGFSETPRKRTRRGGVHTPVLQSIDTSPASIDAFQRRHDLAAPAMQLRPFVQGSVEDGDIFAISLPPAACGAASTPEVELSARKGRADLGLDSSAFDLEVDPNSDENRASGLIACEEPRKAPTWVRQGPPMPLGELRLDDPRASLDFDSTLDLSGDMDLDEQTAEERGREWPPSPKKSPVKRRLLFQPAAATNITKDRESMMFEDLASVHGDVEEDSILGGRDGTFTLHQQRHTHNTPSQANHLEEEHDRPSSLPQLQKPDRPAARGRKSLLRRRRTTNMHEDPITSPRLDPSTRVSKHTPRSRQSSAESQAGLGTNAASLGMEEAEASRSSETPPSAEPSAEDSLWNACGRDLRRWNMGDFDIGNHLGIDNGILW